MHRSSRIISTTFCNKNLNFPSSFFGYRYGDRNLASSFHRPISSTTHLDNSWMNKIKGVFTGNKTSPEDAKSSSDSFTLLRFADEMKNARRIGAFKQYIVGRSSEATFADAFEKQEAIIRYLGGFDSTGENLQVAQKQEAAKHCKCTIADVENALAKFTWAREAQKKMENLKKEGKPMPKNINEVQKLMGSTPLDLAKSNLAKSGQISRNALCPCGSKKRYKRYTFRPAFFYQDLVLRQGLMRSKDKRARKAFASVMSMERCRELEESILQFWSL